MLRLRPKFLIFSATFFTIFILLGALLPSLLSTPTGTRLWIAMLNQSISGEINVKKVNLSWFGPQEIENMTLSDPAGQEILSIQKAISPDSLFKLLLDQGKFSSLDINQVKMILTTDETGRINIQKTLGISLEDHLETRIDSPILVNLNQATIHLFDSEKPFSIFLNGNTEFSDQIGSFDIDLEIKNFYPKNWKTLKTELAHYLTEKGLNGIHIQADIKHFPTLLLEELLKYRLLNQILGKEINVNLKPEKKDSIQEYLLKASSPTATLESHFSLNENKFRILTPSKLKLSINPDVISSLTNQITPLSNTELEITISRLELPTSLLLETPQEGKCSWESMGTYTLFSQDVLFNENEKITNLQSSANWQALKCSEEVILKIENSGIHQDTPFTVFLDVNLNNDDLFKKSISILQVIQKAKITVNQFPIEVLTSKGHSLLFHEYIGSPLNVSGYFEQTNSHYLEGNLAFETSKLSLKQTKLAIGKELKPIHIEFDLNDRSFEYLKNQIPSSLHHILKGSNISLDIDSNNISFENPIHEVALIGKITLSNLPEKQKLALDWTAKRINQDFSIKANGFFGNEITKGVPAIQIEGLLSEFFGDRDSINPFFQIEASAKLNQFPTSFLSLLVEQNDISPIIGPSIDFNCSIAFDRHLAHPGYFDLLIDSKLLHGRTRIKIDKKLSLYESNKPTTEIRLEITPESYDYLRTAYEIALPKMKLASEATLEIFLKHLEIPLDGTTPDYKNAEYNLETSIFNLSWANQNPLPPVSLSAQISSHQLSKESQIIIKGDIRNHEIISGKITLQNFFNSAGKLSFSPSSLSIQGALATNKLPLNQDFVFLPKDLQDMLRAIYGDTLDCNFTTTLSHGTGTIQAKLQGVSGSSQLDGYLDHGILGLNAPFEHINSITPLFHDYFEKKSTPVLKDIIESKEPLRIVIQPSQFSLPLFPFMLDKISIQKGAIYLGKLICSPKGSISFATNLLGLPQQEELALWFTPIYFSIHQGLLDLNRFDFLLGKKYPLALWGTLTLAKQDGDFYLGIPALTLNKAFHVPNLPDNYLMQIPFKFHKRKIELDKTVLTSRIATLMARTHSDKQVQWIGTAIDMAISKNIERASPEPTTQPFPWEGELQQKSDEKPTKLPPPQEKTNKNTTHSSSKEKSKRKSFFKQIEKEATSLLEQLLPLPE